MSALAVAAHHDWRLVGPAYRGDHPRPGSAPVLQKYDASDPVTPFVRDPTASLPFGDEDVVYVPAGGDLLLQTDVRKLYLATHKRFYLVVCELHCNAPGFPNASRTDVCEAGFVIRRRVPRRPLRPQLEGRLGELVGGVREAQRVAIERVSAAGAAPADVTAHASFGVGFVDAVQDAVRDAVDDLVARTRTTPRAAPAPKIPPLFVEAPAAAMRVQTPQEKAAAQAEQELADWHAQLTEYVDEHDLRLGLQGWFADPRAPGVGAWQRVAETPTRVEESVVPLYPLVPPPTDEQHAARGRTIWFGVVPTASADLDATGAARFDEHGLYEIRCFVRRHDPSCPRTPVADGRDCKGPLFWSERTAPYRVAGHFDLHGTSNQPVSVKLPSLAALRAQANALPRGAKLAKRGPDGRPVVRDGKPVEDPGKFAPSPCGRGAPFRISLPKASLPRMVEPGPMAPPVPLGLGTGSFGLSIPLVTIVALFVLRIFLAILSLLFPPINFLKSLAFAVGNPLEDPLLLSEAATMVVLAELDPPEARLTSCLPPLPEPPR